MSDDFQPLEAFQDLPDDDEATYRIGNSLVRFTPHHEYGRLAGWHVTTDDPGYRGYLVAGRTTDWTETGPEPMRTYGFEYRGAREEGPIYMTGPSTDVTIAEFKRIYFGDYD